MLAHSTAGDSKPATTYEDLLLPLSSGSAAHSEGLEKRRLKVGQLDGLLVSADHSTRQGGSRRTGLDRNMRSLVQVSGLEISPQLLE